MSQLAGAAAHMSEYSEESSTSISRSSEASDSEVSLPSGAPPVTSGVVLETVEEEEELER